MRFRYGRLGNLFGSLWDEGVPTPLAGFQIQQGGTNLQSGRERIRGLEVSPLPRKAADVYRELIQKMQSFDPNFDPPQVYLWHRRPDVDDGTLACIRYKEGVGRVILVADRLAQGDETLEEYKRFVFVNTPISEWNVMPPTNKAVSIWDFFQNVAAHEATHLRYQDHLELSPLNEAKEPHAFWYSEIVTGLTSLFLSFRRQYPDSAVRIYDNLHALGREQSVLVTLKDIDHILH